MAHVELISDHIIVAVHWQCLATLQANNNYFDT